MREGWRGQDQSLWREPRLWHLRPLPQGGCTLLSCSANPSFLKPRRCWTWSTSYRNRSRKESSRSLSSKDWMPQVTKPRFGKTTASFFFFFFFLIRDQ
uniref:Uncharacterized protein n=1 Tax=Suricata suricatta TaxID=37032 RepID=A0A673UY36_SURSU